VSDVETRLAEARARKKARDDAAAAVAEARANERELASLERDEAVLAALETLNGGTLGRELARVDVDHVDGTPIAAVIVKKPKVGSWRSFTAQVNELKGVEKDALNDKLWRACLAWPELQKVEAMIGDQPFVRDRICNAIARLAGVRDEDIAGK
jgi:hypothetical protein